MVLLAPFRLIFRVARRFHEERCGQTAAALSFTTLLGLVPMIAVGAALISTLPFSVGLGAALEKFLLANLLPEKAGTLIAKYVGLFAYRAGRVTLVGLLIIAATAVFQMLTIERAINAIWKIRVPRPMLKRVAIHLLALLVGPLIFGGSLAGITYLASVSFGVVDEPAWVNTYFFRALPVVLMASMFALLYWGAPNRPVAPFHAALGGSLAALGFAGMHRLFGFYVSNFPVYATVYGAFAAIPIFLLWLYFSWGVILIGALVVAELPGAARPR